ncbi:MAG: PAS domain-containing sensor histidine kinase [Lentimicrobium sp.]|nr:PAS domain-containing sensor histidine kinase [Lentimicrobium sp.]
MKSKKLKSPEIGHRFSSTSVLNYFIDQSGMPFAFSLNGKALGDSLHAGHQGLPEHMYQGYVLSKNEDKNEHEPFKSVFIENRRTFLLNGVLFTFLISRFQLPDVGRAVAMVSIRDITASHEITGDEHIDEILPELIAGNMTDVFYVYNEQGKLVFVSRAIEKLLGYSVEEVMKSSIAEYIATETKSQLNDYLKKMLGLKNESLQNEEEKNPRLFEIQMVAANQEKRWVEISVAPYTNKNNLVKGVYGIIKNISEQKQIQEEIQTSLQFEIERSKLKSKYISSVSHEFRTPLSIIYSNLQLLESHFPELDAETIADSFSLSKLAVKSLLRVLDKITIIDAAGKGKLEFKPLLTDFPELLRDLVKELDDMEIVAGRILVKADPRIEKVYLDDYLFHHIFANLLQNALVYSDKKQFVEFSVSMTDSDFLNVEIRDSGIGIPQEDMDLIFEPFYRASNSRFSKGSGLGLAVVKECLKLHNGTILIESQTSRGTTVKVKLPIMQNDAV